ncbi:MAG: 3-hydroxyacyl-CoA dehydrogenase [Gaiellales bacterium]
MTEGAIIGAGTIGIGWAVALARGGLGVRLHDPDAQQLERALEDVAARLADLEEFELLDEPPAAILARVSARPSLADAIGGVQYIQECAPELLELKQRILGELDALTPRETIIASSSSAITASAMAADLPGRERCLVVHPGNPPYLLPVVELVPAPFTREDVVERASALLAGAGLSPVRVRVELEGFVFNRLQGAMLREAYALVRDGVASVEDIDRIVTEGLGRRYSVVGPFETSDLNVRGGIAAHARRMGAAYARMGDERGDHARWSDDLIAQVDAERRAILPLEQWSERVAWRDRALMRLARARRELS